MDTLNQLNITTSKCLSAVKNYFSSRSCVWNPKKEISDCSVSYKNDKGALRCLSEGRDVAFMSLDVFNNLTSEFVLRNFKIILIKFYFSIVEGLSTEKWVKKLPSNQFKILCPFNRKFKKQTESDDCYLNWTPRGNIMIHKDTKPLRKGEILNSLKTMDKLFGKHYKAHTIPFTLFGPFDKKNNVLFRDTTDSLKSKNELAKVKLEKNLEEIYENMLTEICVENCSSTMKLSILILIVGLIHIFVY